MTRRARALAAAALAVALAGCAHRAGDAPPFPLGSPEPHVEPDLVGVVHVVRAGETLYRIAKAYGVPVAELVEVNGLADPRQVAAGTELFIPGAPQVLDVATASLAPRPGALPGGGGGAIPRSAAPPGEDEPPRADRLEPKLRWPVQGVLYSRFGVRQGQRHDGIDIAAPEGTAVGAAAAGTVLYAGAQAGYGSIVILRHDANLLTLYAHASAVLVKQGDRVAAGQPVARVGQTGRTTGPHLHFEVREGTRPRNPLLFLP